MKYLIVASILISTAAFSCPDLSGTYAFCRSKNNILIESTDLVVDQQILNGITHYSLSYLQDGMTDRDGYTLIADGIPSKEEWISETGVRFVSVTMARCMNDKLYLESDITADGNNWKKDQNWIVRKGARMIQTSKGVVGSMAFTDVLTCN